MKQSKRIALCGMLSALAVVIMLMAYFPYLTYALPALSGALFAIVLIELGGKWAFGSYATAAIIALLLCEKEAAVIFVAFFGYYPIVKAYLERISSKTVEYLLKFLLFNVAVIVSYVVIIFVFGIPLEGLGDFGKYTLLILLALANIMFVVYDLALTRVYVDYMGKLHTKIMRLLK